MLGRLIAFGIIHILITYKFGYNAAVVFKFTNAVCESWNKSWIIINNCRLHAISRNKTVFNFNATVLHPCNNIWVDIQVFKRANGYKPWLIKTTLDACRFARKLYNPIAILVYKLFKEFSNLNHTCPYMGQQLIEGFYLRPDLLNLPLPTGDYLLALNWKFDKKPQFCTNLYYQFIE